MSLIQVKPDAPGAGPLPHADPPVEISQLFDSERQRLLRIAVALVGDRASAEDVVQEAFAALQRRWDSLKDTTNAAGYLSVSVANGARSVLRRRRVALRHLRVEEPDAQDEADTTALLADEHRSVVTAVRRLPKRQQQVVVLRYWSGMSEAQIAETLGISVGTVKSSASRAVANVQKQLEAEDG